MDRGNRQRIVRDPKGDFWTLPHTENPWDDRRPVTPMEEMELEPVLGHYRYMLGIPF